MTSLRGVTLPETYWLTWLFPSLAPRSAAMRTRSTCLRPALSMALLSLVWKVSRAIVCFSRSSI